MRAIPRTALLYWSPALLLPLLLASGPLLAELLDSPLALWLPLAFAYLGLPLADRLLGEDAADPPQPRSLLARRAVAALPALVGLLGVLLLVLAAAYVVHRDPPLHGWIALAWSAGLIGGLAINAAHELGHRRERGLRALATALLAPLAYAHFPIEHNGGHHRAVATPEDSASARLGESFWRFLLREWPGAWRRAFRLERARLAACGRGAWSPGNRVLGGLLLTALSWGGIALWLGWAALPFLLFASAVAHLQLSTANYVEHYGLLRRRRADGRREPVAAAHSWNSAAWLSNAMLLNLARHADHHAEVARSFDRLRHLPEAPQLPAGYPAMFTLAYLPPLWFRVMDRRVWAAAGGNPQRIHLDPRGGARALARLRAADARPGAPDACPRRWRACGEPAGGRVPRHSAGSQRSSGESCASRPESGA